MVISVPNNALVVLAGPPGSGKSTFAARHFSSTEIVSSDECRALVSDDISNMEATAAAFRVLHAITRERLRAGRLAVVDATNLLASSRKPLLVIARRHRRPAVAIVLALALELCIERNRRRRERDVPVDAIRRQHARLAGAIQAIAGEGFTSTWVLDSPEAVEAAVIAREPAGG